MERLDLDAITKKWLSQCGSCDAGLPMSCTCPDNDPRTVILQMVNHLDRIYDNHTLLLASTMGEAVDELEDLLECQRVLRRIKERTQLLSDWNSREVYLMIPPKLIANKPGLDNQVS